MNVIYNVGNDVYNGFGRLRDDAKDFSGASTTKLLDSATTVLKAAEAASSVFESLGGELSGYAIDFKDAFVQMKWVNDLCGLPGLVVTVSEKVESLARGVFVGLGLISGEAIEGRVATPSAFSLKGLEDTVGCIGLGSGLLSKMYSVLSPVFSDVKSTFKDYSLPNLGVGACFRGVSSTWKAVTALSKRDFKVQDSKTATNAMVQTAEHVCTALMVGSKLVPGYSGLCSNVLSLGANICKNVHAFKLLDPVTEGIYNWFE